MLNASAELTQLVGEVLGEAWTKKREAQKKRSEACSTKGKDVQ